MKRFALALAVTICAASSLAGQPAPRTVEIGVDDGMKYSLATINAKPGETIRIVLKSTSTLPKLALAHNLVILQKGTNAKAFVEAGVSSRETDFIAPKLKDKVIAATPMAGPGETVEVSVTVPKVAGKYDFVCTFPGHYNLGMKGVLIVG